jgi:hypothetical protein
MKKLISSLIILISLTSYSQIYDNVITGSDAKVIIELKECCKCDVYPPQGAGGMALLKKRLQECKNEKITKVAIPVGGIVLVILIVFFFINNEKNKKDPIKNLDNLRKNNIITKKEFEDKVDQSKIISKQELIIKKRNKETDKLIIELKNLRAKGILSEIEYREKLTKIKERTS